MIWKSRQRMVAFIVLILIATIGATLGIIYFTTYKSEKEKNMEILSMFAENYALKGMPREEVPELPEKTPDENEPGRKPENEYNDKADYEMMDTPPDKPVQKKDEKEGHRYEVSTFYAVAFQSDGTVNDYLNDDTSGLTDGELIETAENIKAAKKSYGKGNGFVYLVTTEEEVILVTMMDTSVVDYTISALIRHMVLFGGCAVLFLTLLTIYLSKWIMKPATESYEKQKRFISDAGHELKTPIAAIGANAELLRQETPESKWLDNIIYENNRMSVIVHELLDMARIEQVKPVMETLDFSTLCMASVMPFEAEAFEHGVELNYEIADNIRITGNSTDLEKLVGILIDNAISHCSIPGSVQLTLEKERDKAKLSVSNTGNELSPEEYENMFERFYRSDASRTDQNGHYGLGLAIAKTIVQAHGGTIKVKYQDGNILFTVTL